MVVTIDLRKAVQDAIVAGVDARSISENMFGGVLIDTHDSVMGGENYRSIVAGSDYSDHFTAVYDNLSLNLLRFPGGEFPDGFVVEESGNWTFKHNKINGGNNVINDPITGNPLTVGGITQSYLDSLTPAFSLSNPELIDAHLLGSGRMTFTESLQMAFETASSYSLVLPEFQYLKVPIDRDPDEDGNKIPFVAADHIKLTALQADIQVFLEDLFLNDAYNNGNIPADFILELGNEDFYGWNKHYFPADSAKDLDSYSAYAFGCLGAIKDFRVAHPEIQFKVALQAGGVGFVWEMHRNFSDENGTDLFGQVDVISVIHEALDVTLAEGAGLEHVQFIKDGINALLGMISAAGGDSSNTELYMSGWSAVSSGVSGLYGVNHALPAAGAALSLFSSMFEMGMDYAASWGIGGWGGFGTNLSSVDTSGILEYAPIAEVYRQMAESLIGTTQIITPLMDVGRRTDFSVFAYRDNAKAVLFLAANDYSGTETINLGYFGTIGYAWVERISTTLNTTDGYDTVVTREMVSFTDGSVSVTFNNPYEVLRLIVAKAAPGDGYLHLWGKTTGDVLNGGLSDDLLQGNGGDDILNGGEGNDTLDGGAGIDTVDYSAADGAVAAYLNLGTSSGAYGADTLSCIENLIGSDFDDRLVGDIGENVLNGGAGNDILKTKGGDDVVHGGTGDDTITGSSGNEALFGGDGSDIIVALAGDDTVAGGAGGDFLYGGQGGDILTGDAGNDKLRGNLGRDTLSGGDGVDDIRGGDGNDTLDGGAGNDFLFGEYGADMIAGGAGNDALSGGTGGGSGDGFADTFVYKNTATEGYDRIKDFEDGIDRIDLSDFGYDGFADVSVLASRIAAGVKLNFGFGNVLLVEGLALADFDAGDVLL